jgi:hypothetical protein
MTQDLDSEDSEAEEAMIFRLTDCSLTSQVLAKLTQLN